jgi:flagellin-like protein
MMTIMGKRFTNRGISTIIAALLLIAIAIAAGVLLYVFSMGLIGSLQGTGGQQTKDQLIMEAYNWQTSGSLIVNLRNTGGTTLNLAAADFYLGGVITGTPTLCSGSSSVGPQAACTVTITPPASMSYSSGVAYVLKIGLPDGGVMSYAVVDGSAA